MTGSKISSKAKIGCNVKIGDFSIIQDYVWLFPNVVLTNDPHPPSENIQGCQVAEFASVGAKSVILPGVNIGKDSLIGAGSIVNRDVPPLKIVVGNPARIIGDVRQIKFQSDPKKHVYPWRHQFHRGYPEDIVRRWREEFPNE